MGNKITITERYERALAAVPEDPEGGEQESVNLYSKLNPMLFTSELVYAFAVLRKMAQKMDLKREDLIVPEGTTEGQRKIAHSRAVDDSIKVENVALFIQENLKVFDKNPRINSDIFVHGLLALSKLKNAHVVHFDNDNAGKTFVYGLLVNHDQKRITVVLRGSSNLGDWKSNFQFLKDDLETPELLKDLGFDKTKKIEVHGGFKDYIFYTSKTSEQQRQNQKYSQLKQMIINLYESGECDGYELFVTGHSLGGAVSTMMAFQLAASRKISKFLKEKPLVNISFASPYVGGKVWCEAFQMLEKAGRIQHIRVSNNKDVVPSVAPTPNFRHVGVNLHLDPDAENKYTLRRPGNRSLFGQWSFSVATNHYMESYWDRCKDIKNYIGDTTIKEIYDRNPVS